MSLHSTTRHIAHSGWKAVKRNEDGGRRNDAPWTYDEKGSAVTMEDGHHCARWQRTVGYSDAQQVLQTFSRLDERKRFIFSA
ncbi:hypothetical protein H257_06821 [Aphanomyces astaci]|uniref:Uncharacterized protein n=1 Tax=Aphanomyces astaci TaxID=112090 RepID=W4GIS3_APHAT|nr:hypothetical protein H257_06821 [Aphanomyces astaci]ETV79557.1 hypothetical protein H257_06821 [Aphanomyces astaci]|eukprot:XP_009830493.1 hypothetical protein H257_06821 [Aphanomyces astaci]